MNYFDYNLSRTQGGDSDEPEMLTFTGDEVIEVNEDHTVTVDDVRAYIRELHRPAAAEAAGGNVVSIRTAKDELPKLQWTIEG